MLKKFSVFSCLLLFMSSCDPSMKFTTKEEYVQKPEWSQEKGLVKNTKSTKASWSVEWE